MRLYAKEIVSGLVEGLGSAQWSRKKSCAEAVVSLAQVRNVSSVGDLESWGLTCYNNVLALETLLQLILTRMVTLF